MQGKLRQRRLGRVAAALSPLWITVLGCGESDAASFETSGRAPTSANGGGGTWGAGDASSGPVPGLPTGTMGGIFVPAEGESVADLPPEVEAIADFEQPAAGARYLYVPNPPGDSVAVLDSETRGIEIVYVGEAPRFVATVPGADVAIVLSDVAGTQGEAHVLRTEASGTSVHSFDVTAGANAIAVAPDGKHAIVFFDWRLRDSGAAAGSYQDVNVLTLDEEEPSAHQLTVGFRPQSITFDADGEQGFVVTEDGISVVDFAKVDGGDIGVADLIRISDDPADTFPDVSIAPNGELAVARNEDGTDMRLVDLSTGDVTQWTQSLSPPNLEMDQAITDVDLSPDGAFLLAAVRSQQALLRIPLPDGFTDATSNRWLPVENAVVGSVTITPDGARALVYTTAVLDERFVLLDLAGDGEQQAVRLRKGVKAVAVTEQGDRALVIHAKKPGSPFDPGIDDDERLDRSYGYSLVDLTSGAVKLQETAAPLGAFVVTPDGDYVFVLVRDAGMGTHEVHRCDLNGFQIERVEVQSPPLTVGTLPESKQVFVGQEHPAGRITFFDWESGDYQVVTGFENTNLIRSR